MGLVLFPDEVLFGVSAAIEISHDNLVFSMVGHKGFETIEDAVLTFVVGGVGWGGIGKPDNSVIGSIEKFFLQCDPQDVSVCGVDHLHSFAYGLPYQEKHSSKITIVPALFSAMGYCVKIFKMLGGYVIMTTVGLLDTKNIMGLGCVYKFRLTKFIRIEVIGLKICSFYIPRSYS